MDKKTVTESADGRLDACSTNAESKEYSFGVFRRIFVCSAVAAAILAILRALALCLYYNEGIGLIERDAALPQITDVLTIVCVCLAIAASLILGKSKKMPSDLPDPRISVIVSGIITGLSLIGLFAFLMYRGVHESVKGSGLIIWTVMLIFMIPAALYFFKTAISIHPYSRASAALGFAPVLWAAFFLINVYFEHDAVINNTLRIYTQMSMISVMLFFLNEVRFLVGKAKPALYCGFGNAAVIVLAVSAIPKLVYVFVKCSAFSSAAVYGIVELLLMLCIAFRMALYTSKKSRFTAAEAERYRQSESDEDDEDPDVTEE